MKASYLHVAIAAVCPIEGVSVGDESNRATWAYDPKPEATAQQKTDADNVIATIPVEVLGTVLASDFVDRWTDAEYLLLEKKRAADIAADTTGLARSWDRAVAETTLDMNRASTQTLKGQLVSKGILTQQRADEIFS